MAALRAMCNGDPSPISGEGSLTRQTRSLLETFDAEHRGGAFYGDDGVRYARWMADMLDRWLLRYGELEDARP